MTRDCGCPPNDRHNWNCPLTPIYMQTYWNANPTPEVRRQYMIEKNEVDHQ